MRLLFIALAALVLLLPAAAPAGAQTQRVGNFYVERKADLITDEDRSYAGVAAESEGQQASLSLIWLCVGDYLGVWGSRSSRSTAPGTRTSARCARTGASTARSRRR